MFDPAIAYLRAYLTERDVVVWAIERTPHGYVVHGISGRVAVPGPKGDHELVHWALEMAEYVAERIGHHSRHHADERQGGAGSPTWGE